MNTLPIKHGPSYDIAKIARNGNMAKEVQEKFPDVKYVVDAMEAVHVNVEEADCKKAKAGDPFDCAMARATRRHLVGVNGAYVGLRTAFVICGSMAIRCATTETVRREILANNRYKDFRPGTYRLSAINPSMRLNGKRKRKTGPQKSVRKPQTRKLKNHFTGGLRSAAV